MMENRGANGYRPEVPMYSIREMGYKTPCWIWERCVARNGYGQICGSRGKGKHRGMVYAHRYIYEQLKGPIPKGLQLDHLCLNKNCVNPDHLEPVTHLENGRRATKYLWRKEW